MHTRSIIAWFALLSLGAAQLPLLHYPFDGPAGDGVTLNIGSFSPGPHPLVGHEENCGSLGGGVSALQGNGAPGSEVATGFPAGNLSGSFTLGFCLDASANPGLFQYIFGASGTSSWRIWAQGAAGGGNLMMAGGGWNDVVTPGGAGDGGPVHCAWVYDAPSSTCFAYRDGELVATVAQPSFNGWGASGGTLAFGRFPQSGNTMKALCCMDDARLYDRALTAGEVATWAFECLPSTPWQINSSQCSLDIDGLNNGPSAGLKAKRCFGQAVSYNLSGTPAPWEVAVTVGGQTVPDQGLLSSWRVNIDFADPSLSFFNNLAWNPANPLGTTTMAATTPLQRVDAQMAVLDAASADGVALSAAVSLIPSPDALFDTVPGPAVDNGFVGPIDVTAPPLNGSPVVFYGSSYSQIWVNSNGRVMFNGGDSDPSPAAASALADNPAIGVWSDWGLNAGGSITIGRSCAGELVVRWEEVPYTGQSFGSPRSSFDVRYNFASQEWGIENLGSVAGVGVTQVMIGCSPGNVAPGPAIDPGQQDFTQVLSAAIPGANLIYEQGWAGSLNTPGGLLGGAGPVVPVLGITFVPSGPGYFWASH